MYFFRFWVFLLVSNYSGITSGSVVGALGALQIRSRPYRLRIHFRSVVVPTILEAQPMNKVPGLLELALYMFAASRNEISTKKLMYRF